MEQLATVMPGREWWLHYSDRPSRAFKGGSAKEIVPAPVEKLRPAPQPVDDVICPNYGNGHGCGSQHGIEIKTAYRRAGNCHACVMRRAEVWKARLAEVATADRAAATAAADASSGCQTTAA